MFTRIGCSVLSILGALAIGCAGETKRETAAATKAEGPEWKLQGTRLIACCCASPCS